MYLPHRHCDPCRAGDQDAAGDPPAGYDCERPSGDAVVPSGDYATDGDVGVDADAAFHSLPHGIEGS